MDHPKSFLKCYRLLILFSVLLVCGNAVEVSSQIIPIPRTYVLTVIKQEIGVGSVTVNPGTLSWNGNTGTEVYLRGTSVTLTATAGANSVFQGWYGGGCSGRQATCTMTMNASQTVAAYFTRSIPITFPSRISGTITPAFGGVNITTGSGGYSISLPDGTFFMLHQAGTTTLTATASGCDTYSTSVTVVEMHNTNVNIALNCSWTSIASTIQSFTSSGGTGSVGVTIPSGYSWMASSNASLITITAGLTGTGGGAVSYSVSANTTGSTRTGTMTIGGQTFTVTQTAVDTTPDQFTFNDLTGQPLSTAVTSNPITVSGINAAAAISVTGGQYSINGGVYTSIAGTVNNGNTVTVRLTSSASYSTTVNATLTIGGVSDTFAVTTGKAPVAPVASVTSANAVILDVTVTNSITGAPANYTPQTVVSFNATGVFSTANISISYSSLPANPVFYKVVNGQWKRIYPTNQSNGITNIFLSGNTLSFTIADNSDCDSNPAVGVIYDPVVVGTNAALYFPHVDTSLPWQTEIAVINTSDQPVTGTLRGMSDEGQLIETKPVTLSAHGRRQITVANEFTNHTDIGYIIFDTDSAAVQGYTKFYQTGIYRAAIPAVKEINTSDIYISHIDSGAQWCTGVSLVNTTSATKQLTITFNNGLNVPYTLNAKHHRAFMIGELFNQPIQPDIESAVITNASGIIGLELFGNISGGNHLDGVLLTNKTASTIYYPHVASDNVWWTGIVAYNPSESACTITITPYSAQGTPLPTSTSSLAGKEKYVGLVSALGLPAQTAWFKIDSTSSLTGFELFGTADGNQLAAYAGGGGTGGKSGVFAKIEKSGWTGIAFVNTEAGTASVTLTAYNDAGAVVATQPLSLAGYAKVVNMAESIFTQNIGAATYIAYSSDRNVVGFQLNGSADGTMLDGLPAM